MIIHIVISIMHIFKLCACMCAHNYNAVKIFHSVPKMDLTLKIWLKSDLIGPRYINVYIIWSTKQIASLCAFMCAHKHNYGNILCLVPQKAHEFQVLWKSELIWLSYRIILSISGVIMSSITVFVG